MYDQGLLQEPIFSEALPFATQPFAASGCSLLGAPTFRRAAMAAHLAMGLCLLHKLHTPLLPLSWLLPTSPGLSYSGLATLAQSNSVLSPRDARWTTGAGLYNASQFGQANYGLNIMASSLYDPPGTMQALTQASPGACLLVSLMLPPPRLAAAAAAVLAPNLPASAPPLPCPRSAARHGASMRWAAATT